MNDKCPEWSNSQRCESCGAWCIDNCVRCGAPQCCPQCCSINTERAAREKADEENNRLRALVDRLPKTADGVPLVPGMTVFIPHPHPSNLITEREVIAPYGTLACLTKEPAHSGCCESATHRQARECYSTREAAEGGKGESMSNEQAQRIRWDEQFKTYRLEDEQGNVVLNFTSPQAGAEHHYAMWRKVERLRATVERYRAHLRRMQADATTYLMPDRPDCDRAWFISRILWHLDGPQERAIEALAASGPAQEGEKAKGSGT